MAHDDRTVQEEDHGVSDNPVDQEETALVNDYDAQEGTPCRNGLLSILISRDPSLGDPKAHRLFFRKWNRHLGAHKGSQGGRTA